MGVQVIRLMAAALLCGASPAVAQAAPAPAPAAQLAPASVTVAPLPAAPAVEAYYASRGNAAIWLRDAASREAAQRLPSILRRAQLDGLADGPELARLVESALQRAQAPVPPGKTAAPAFLAEDKLLSAAWVQYVRALSAPIPGMLYGDPALAPKMPLPARVLAEAAKAPSLARHVEEVSAVNPLYAQLRDAAWSQQQLAGEAHSPDARLLTNLGRARLLPPSGRYVVVNAATAQMWMHEDGRLVDSMKVVVGKRDTPTPMLSGTIHYVTYNPYWNIPPDVAQRVVAPLVVKRGTSYLRAAEYEVASDWTDQASVVEPDSIDWKAVAAGTNKVRIRQLPGKNNMMGAIKFGFINDLGIYLHDTPQKGLFAKATRTYSLGCVRVEDAQRFARWLLRKEPAAPSDQPEQHVQLDKGVPIYITYLTAQADGGQLSFVDDIYGLDPKGETRLAVVQPTLAPPSAPGPVATAATAGPVAPPAPAAEAAPASDSAAAPLGASGPVTQR